MYIGNTTASYNGLASIWGLGDTVKAEDIIPKKDKTISADQASRLVDNIGRPKADTDEEIRKNLWYTKLGPMVAKKAVFDGKKPEQVAPPLPLRQGGVRTVRDMPVLDLPPVGFGNIDLKSGKGVLLVLGLMGVAYWAIIKR